MSSAAAQDLSFGLEPPLSPDSIGGLRTATPVAPPLPQLQQPLRQPVAPPAPEPVAPPAPEPVAADAPEPVAASAPEPVAAPAPEQLATPTVAPPLPTLAQSAPASESAAGVHVELHVRLTNGERIRIDSFPNQEAAKTRARQMCRELEESRVWPLLAGRFVRPDAVVSIDLDLTAR